MSLVPRPVVATPITPQDATQLSEVFQMKGLDGFVSAQARQVLMDDLGSKMRDWVGPWTTQEKLQIKNDPEKSKQLKEDIQKKLEAWLPEAARKVLKEKVFQNSDLQEIAEEVVEHLKLSLNQNADEWIGGWYDQLMQNRFVDPAELTGWLANPLGQAIGSAAVKGLQGNILKGLNGTLPQEALDFLKLGPEKFKEYADKMKEYLPAAQFAKAKDQLMSVQIVDLPNQVYGGILASSAAMHFAKFATSCSAAFASCNWYELKRGKEVTQTLVWQLKNKESVTMNLGDFTGMVKMLGDQLGQFDWGALSDIARWNPANQFMEKLDWMENELKKIDSLYDASTGKVLEGFDKVLNNLESRLKQFSDEMLAPLKMSLPCLTPDHCPELGLPFPDIHNWESLKKTLGLDEGLFGEAGKKIPMDEIKKGLKKLGGKIVSKLPITGPKAAITEAEKIPAQNPSQDSDFDPVLLHSGEFFYTATDVTIPGVGLDFQFTRIHRSTGDFLGVLGYGWTHNFAERLLPWTSDPGEGLIYINPEGKKFFLKQSAGNRYTAPAGLFVETEKNDDGFLLRFADGEEHRFDKEGRLLSIKDEKGNQLSCFYNDKGVLSSVVDTLGRPIHFVYRDDGLLEKLEDFTGRVWHFDYDSETQLIAATSPGTPDFPKGKTTRYRYANHRLSLIMDPKGQIYLENFFGTSGNDAGKILAQHYGGDTSSIEARYDGLKTWVKNRRGIYHLYEHDEEGHLLRHSLVKKDGTTKMLREYVYNAAGLQMEEIFPDGLKLKTEWKGDVLQKRFLVDIDGEKLEIPMEAETSPPPDRNNYEYDRWGNIVAIHSPDGDIRKLEVDASNRITKETVKGEARLYHYDANDNIIGMEIPSKNLKVALEYDMLDRMTAKKEILPEDHVIVTRYEYDPEGHLTRFVYPMGNDIRYVYDDEGHLAQKISGEGSLERSVEQYEYDDDGKLVAMINGENEKSIIFRDSFERVAGFASPLHNEEHYAYDANSLPVSKKNIDVQGRLLAEESWEYDAHARVTRHKRHLFQENPKKGIWLKEHFEYNDNGDLVSYVDYDGAKWILEYASAGKLLRLIDPLGVAHDPNEKEVSNLQEKQVQHDPLGRPVLIGESKMEWDDNGRLSKITDAKNAVTHYTYDNLNRLVREQYPTGVENAYAYDNANRLIGMTDTRHTAFHFQYDKEGHVVERKAGQQEQRFSYDGLGRLVDALDFNDPENQSDNVRTGFVYDSLSRNIAEAQNGQWVRKNYDGMGRKTGLHYASSLQVVRRFDAMGDLLETFAGRKKIAGFQYSKMGEARETEWGNGVKLLQNFDSESRLIAQSFSLNEKEKPVVLDYAYFSDGRLSQSKQSYPSRSESFGYGASGELLLPDPVEKFEKNAAGFVTAEENFFYHYDDWGRLSKVVDANGNILSRNTYDVMGRLVGQTSSEKTWKWSYDDWNAIEIYAGEKPDHAVVFAGGLDMPLALKTFAQDDAFYFYHLDRLGSVRFLTDAQKKPVEWYDYQPYGSMELKDSSGKMLETSLVGNNLGFTARPFEKETGLMNFRYRYYSPGLHEFLMPDPLGYKNDFFAASNIFTPRNFSYHQGQGGASRTTWPDFAEDENGPLLLDTDLYFAAPPVDPLTPETDLNLYAGGDPLNQKDPLGLYALILDRSRQRMSLFDKNWNNKGGWNVLTKGTAKTWMQTNGDTPSGLYKIGKLYRYSHADELFGWGKIDLTPMAGKVMQTKRSGLRIHGGGHSLKNTAMQKLKPTHGCVRMHNSEVVDLIQDINALKAMGDDQGTLEVMDSLNDPFANLSQYYNHSDFSALSNVR
ncbi:MAG: DUF6531 domain-containing protein [Deltaproteobacteria bacterium]|nr:DUF6531 domain-containing protein [Deltaproteobacteria bacterium]